MVLFSAIVRLKSRLQAIAMRVSIQSHNFSPACIQKRVLSNVSFQIGKLYDSEGNRRKWWSNSTLVNFKERSRCLVDQYSNYTFFGYQVSKVTQV